jgi:hypothetical protein
MLRSAGFMHSAALRHAAAVTAAVLIAFCSPPLAANEVRALYSYDSFIDAAAGAAYLLQVASAAFDR